ncbi:MAG: ABC transporter permease [Spirochaetes bacterium]|nr:ABC transporter permease [Spirochaetota bacterium]MBU0956212.1 ABC transporter permease [Spirochaetota bacterium]
MKQQPLSGAALVLAIMKKDLVQFSRDKLYFWFTIVGLALYIGTFWLMPANVTETATIGVYYTNLGSLGDALSSAGEGTGGEEGLELLVFPSADDLKAVVGKTAEAWKDADGKLVVVAKGDKAARPDDGRKLSLSLGLVFSDSFLADTLSGRRAKVQLLVNNDTPAELRQAMQSMVREMVYMIGGSELPVTEPDEETVILGTDRMGAQISMRERMRPMLVYFVLMMESLSLAALISIEISNRTVLALVTSPAKLVHVLVAKILFGTLLAAGQAVVLLALIGSFASPSILILLAAAILGGLMFSGVAMFVGSMGKDFMGTLSTLVMIILPLAIPAFAAMFPGSAPAWVRFVPSYGLIDIFIRAASYGDGWLALAPSFGLSFLWVLVLLVIGLVTLTRKVARL